MSNLLTSNNCKIFINDKPATNIQALNISATVSDPLFFCSLIVSDNDAQYVGQGYIEKIINNEFYIQLLDETTDRDYFSRNYL